MFKIEQNLLINKASLNMSILDVLDQYYKQMHMLITNLYLTYQNVDVNNQNELIFPKSSHLYDGAWYKNMIVASHLIYNRLHMLNDAKIDYASIFNDAINSNFIALAKLWNKINYIVRTNVDKSLWATYKMKWNLTATTSKLEQLINLNINYNQAMVNYLAFDVNQYQDDSIARYQQICQDLALAENKKIKKELKEQKEVKLKETKPKAAKSKKVVKTKKETTKKTDKQVNKQKLKTIKSAKRKET